MFERFKKRRPTQEQVDRLNGRVDTLTSINNDLSGLTLKYQSEIRKLNRACVRNKRKTTNLRVKVQQYKQPAEAASLVSSVLDEFRPGWQFEAILKQKAYSQAVFEEVRNLALNSRFNIVIREEIEQRDNGHLYFRHSRLHQTTDDENRAFLQAAQDAGYPIQLWNERLRVWSTQSSESPLFFDAPIHYYRVDPDFVPQPVTAEVAEELVADPPAAAAPTYVPAKRPMTTGEVAAAIEGAVIGGVIADSMRAPSVRDEDATLPWEGHGGSSGGAGASGAWGDGPSVKSPGGDFSDIQSSVSSTEERND